MSCIHIKEFYDYEALREILRGRGIREQPAQFHDEFVFESQLLALAPASVRMNERIAGGVFAVNGVSLLPLDETIGVGNEILNYRIQRSVAAIQREIDPALP